MLFNFLSTNNSIKLIDKKNSSYFGTISSFNNNSFVLTMPECDIEKLSSSLFLYGKKVDDFQTLNKDYLFTLNFAATREIDRILQSTNIKINSLENRIELLESTMQSLI